MHPLAEFLLDPFQGSRDPFRYRLAPQPEFSVPLLLAVVREAEEIEGLRSTFPARPAVRHREPSELDEACLVRVQLKRELAHPLPEVVEKLCRIRLALAANDEVIGVTYDDSVPEAEGIAVLWEDLLQRSPLPPRVAGVTGAEYELARLVQGGPVRVIEAPPAETWIWSDLHLRDRGAFEATGRPFPSLRAMEGRMLEAWTNNVSPGDTIVCLGDVAHPSAFEGDALVARLRNCPGRRLLILGNHDLGHRAALEEVGFRDQIAAALCATDPPVALTHMPLGRIPYGCVHLHGHLHAKGSPAPRRRDVGVDAIGLRATAARLAPRGSGAR